MDIQVVVMEPARSNCYLLRQGRGAVVVDPGGDSGPLLAAIARDDLRLEAILLTHLHYDHIAGVPGLVAATGAKVFASPRDAFLRALPLGGGGGRGLPPVEDFSFEGPKPKLTLFNLPCIVLPTPGHTPGSLSYFFPWAESVFTGDLLFRKAVGRTDGPGGDGAVLLASIRERILTLPDDTGVFPGHGVATWVKVEKRDNPHLRPFAV